MGYWTQTPIPDDERTFRYGTAVRVKDGYVNAGRTGTCCGWATATRQHHLYQLTGEPEVLIDSEGPLVYFDDREDDAMDWFPGQAMYVLEVAP